MPVPERWLEELERVTAAHSDQPSLERVLEGVLRAAQGDGAQGALLQLVWLQFVVLADVRRILQEISGLLARNEQRIR